MTTLQRPELVRSTIGGSDVAAILGASEYQDNTPFKWWMRHFGLEPSMSETLRMRAGRDLEDALADFYEQKVGVKLEPVSHIVDKEFDWFGGNPDRRSVDRKRIVELKCIGWRLASKLGAEGTDEVIMDHLLQNRVYEGLARQQGDPIEAIDWVYWSWDWDEPKLFTAQPDEEFFLVIRGKVREFKEAYIDTQSPPPIDGSDAATDFLRRAFQVKEGSVMVADEATEEIIARYRDVIFARLSGEEEEKKLKNQLMQIMGEHERLQHSLGPDITFKMNNGKAGYTVQPQDPSRALSHGFRRSK